jgi:hypothetical protein
MFVLDSPALLSLREIPIKSRPSGLRCSHKHTKRASVRAWGRIGRAAALRRYPRQLRGASLTTSTASGAHTSAG